MKRGFLIALAMAVMPAAALAQVNGTWAGETQGRGGTQQITLTLQGASGTWAENGEESELAEVMVEGNTVSFQRTVEFGGRGGFALTYNGVIDGDEMTLTVSFPGRGGRGPGGGGGAPGGAGPDGGGAGPGGGGPRGGGPRGGQAPIVLTRQ